MRMSKEEQRRQAAAERAVAEWNAKHPVGTLVKYWPGVRQGEGKQGRTRSEASILCGEPCVWIEGARGGVSLSHVEPIVEGEQA